jgi:hypothetical protein
MNVTPAYRERLIRDYKAAYERANGKTAPTVIYQEGWFRFKDYQNRGYRRAAMEEMLECLRERPAYPVLSRVMVHLNAVVLSQAPAIPPAQGNTP